MKIISVHFPKAGGSSLRVQIERLMGQSLLLDYGHDPWDDLGRKLYMNCRPASGWSTATSGPRATRSAMRFRFTFLREPVENLLSHYFFWQRPARSAVRGTRNF